MYFVGVRVLPKLECHVQTRCDQGAMSCLLFKNVARLSNVLIKRWLGQSGEPAIAMVVVVILVVALTVMLVGWSC